MGMLLDNSKLRGNATWARQLELAKAGLADDPNGHRAAMVHLSERAQALSDKLARR